MIDSIIGIDIGFGFTKTTDGNDFLVFKSIYGEAVDFQFRENLLSVSSEEEHIHIDVDGASYFVGELAERQSSSRTFTLDQTQFVATSSKVLALAALSKVLTQPQQSVRIVVGLPIGHYRQYKAELSNMLKATHHITTTDAKGNRVERQINISEVRVLPQPIGTVMDRLLSHQGVPEHKRFVTDKIGILDVGFRTTDYTISDKGRYSERGSLTTQNGISKAFTTISTKLKETCKVDIEIYRLFDAVEQGNIKVRGKAYDLQKITHHAFKQLAATIASDANQVWTDDWDIDAIMITGGGGAVLAPHIQPLIEGVIIPIEEDLDYRLHNVRCYYKFGVNTWNPQAGPSS